MRFQGLSGLRDMAMGLHATHRHVLAFVVVRQRITDIARGQTGDAADTIPASLVPLHL